MPWKAPPCLPFLNFVREDCSSEYRSLLVDSRGFAAQHVLLDLAGGGLGKLRHEGEGMRNFEVSHPFARELAEFVFGCRAARFQYHESARGFSPLLVGNTDNRDFLYRGMAQQDAFDFDRGDVLAAADDDILEAIADLDVAVRMHHCSVSSVEPSVANHLGRGFGIFVVAMHDCVS